MRGSPEDTIGCLELPGDEERHYLRALLQELAQPRLCGSAGAALTARALRRQLTALGYEIEERPFTFSAWPARYLVPLLGGAYLAAILSATGLLQRNQRVAAATTLLALPPLLSALVGSAGALIVPLPWGRLEGSNWLVHPPGGRSRYLVMAHRDSKSQPVSTAIRTLAATLAVLSWSTLLGLTALKPRRAATHRRLATRAAAAVGILAGGILLRCRVGNESPGALDNASGLAALLGVARREQARGDVGFLITDAEELWLAGAREAARYLPRNEAVINLDGLDDHGPFHLIDRRRWRRRSKAGRLSAALVEAAANLGHPLVQRELPLGILVDHLPLARAGHTAITLMHGSRRSLGRVHRPTDHVDNLTGEGVHRTVHLVCHALERVRQQTGP